MTDQIHDDQIHDDHQLVRELAQLPDVPAPLHTVDIIRAVRDGRTRLRRRRLAAGAAVGGLVAAAAALALLAGGLTGTAAARHVEPARTPHVPLTVMAGFGWVPPGFNMTDRMWSKETGGTSESLSVSAADPYNRRLPGGDYGVGLPVSAPDLGENHYSVTSVNGRKAYWLGSGPTKYQGWDFMLWWQLADGRWMFMRGGGLGEAGLKENALRAAAAYDARPEAVPLPFFLSDTGPGFSVDSMESHTTDDGSTWWMKFDFRKGDYSVTMVMGTEKLISTWDTVKHLNCRTQGGIKVCSSGGFLRYSKTPDAADEAWVKGFAHFDHFTLLGANPRDWTTDLFH